LSLIKILSPFGHLRDSKEFGENVVQNIDQLGIEIGGVDVDAFGVEIGVAERRLIPYWR